MHEGEADKSLFSNIGMLKSKKKWQKLKAVQFWTANSFFIPHARGPMHVDIYHLFHGDKTKNWWEVREILKNEPINFPYYSSGQISTGNLGN